MDGMGGMEMQPGALLPEIFLLIGALACLVGGSFLARRRQHVARLIAIGALVAATLAAAADLSAAPSSVFEMTYAVDTLTGAARILISVSTLLVICLGVDELAGDARESETYCLLLLAALGAVLLAGADDLLLVVTGYLLASIPLNGLVGLARTGPAAEAAMKTYLMGALLGIGLMLGVVMLYGLAGTTTYSELSTELAGAPPTAVAFGTVAILGGLMFKAGAVPGHFWVPDAAQGTSATAAAFLTTAPKIGAVVATYRLVLELPATVDWAILIAALAALSMTLGNLAALGQTDPRRLLGWSTVSQAGYALVPVAAAGASDLAQPSMLFFLAGYALTNVTAFAVVAAHPQLRTLASYRGLARTHPGTIAALVVSLLGLVGTPPTALFVGKLTTATAAWDGGLAWLAVTVMLNSVVSLVYYLRWVVPAFLPPKADESATDRAGAVRPWATRTAQTAGVASVLLGVGAGLAWTFLV